MDPQSIINALAARGILYNAPRAPGGGEDNDPGSGGYFVANGRALLPDEVAAQIGLPVDQLTAAYQNPQFESQLAQAARVAGTYPSSSGGGFFGGLLNMVSDIGGGLTGAVANPIASALNVSPDVVKAAMLGAGAMYGGGLLGGGEAAGAAAGAAPAATMSAADLAALDAELGGVAGTGTSAVSIPVASSATSLLASEAGNQLIDASVGQGMTASGAITPAANALAPATVGAGAGAANAADLTAAFGENALAPTPVAATTPTTVATTNALANAATAGGGGGAVGYGGAGDVVNPLTGEVVNAATVVPGSTLTFGNLAQFAKDYGIPLASLISGVTGAYTAKSAAQTQADAARYAADQAYKVYQEQKALQEPFRTAGVTAQNQLLTLLGLQGGTPGAEFGKYARPFGMQDFQADPGYAFRLSEGMKALEASRAAKGGLLGGATGKALTRYGQELGSQEYGNAFNRYQTERANRLAPLGSLMGTGQAAASGMAGSAGQYGANVGNLATSGAAAQAAGQVGATNALTGALNTYMNYAANQDLVNALQRRQSQYSIG